jgi:hypothetical protein
MASPSMESPAMATEKDPLDSGSFGHNQYPSNRYLYPTAQAQGASRAGRNASGLRNDKAYKEPRGCVPSDPTKRRWLFFGVPIGLVVAAGIAIGVVVGVNKRGNSNSSGSDSSSSGGGSGTNTTTYYNTTLYGTAGSGTNGSTVTTDLGVTFTYVNGFEGSWAQDPLHPYTVSELVRQWVAILTPDRCRVKPRAGARACWSNGFGDSTLSEGTRTPIQIPLNLY